MCRLRSSSLQCNASGGPFFPDRPGLSRQLTRTLHPSLLACSYVNLKYFQWSRSHIHTDLLRRPNDRLDLACHIAGPISILMGQHWVEDRLPICARSSEYFPPSHCPHRLLRSQLQFSISPDLGSLIQVHYDTGSLVRPALTSKAEDLPARQLELPPLNPRRANLTDLCALSQHYVCSTEAIPFCGTVDPNG